MKANLKQNKFKQLTKNEIRGKTKIKVYTLLRHSFLDHLIFKRKNNFNISKMYIFSLNHTININIQVLKTVSSKV